MTWTIKKCACGICDTYFISSPSGYNGRYNADVTRLLTGIPELYEACKGFIARWERSGPSGSAQWEKFDETVRQIRAAVKKAEGE